MGSAQVLQGELCRAVAGLWGAHRHPWLFQLLELEPQPCWGCLGMPDLQGPGEHSTEHLGCCACPSCLWRSETNTAKAANPACSVPGSPGNLCGSCWAPASPRLLLELLLWVPRDGVGCQCCCAELKSVSQCDHGVTGTQPCCWSLSLLSGAALIQRARLERWG